MKKFGKNTISNIVTKLWSMVSIYLFIPLYIKILGETSYGLVSVFATLQSTLNLLGMGLSNTLRREFAVGDGSISNSSRKMQLLKSVEFLFWLIGLFIILLCSLGSGVISTKWLNIENLDSAIVSRVLSLMGISIALQLIANLYLGCLFGLEHQVLANTYCVIWSMLKSIGSLLIILLIKPDLILFYSWHIFTDLIYVLVLRLTIKFKCPCNQKWTISCMKNLATIWKYTFGILIISCIALVNRQLDKIVISKFLSLTDLGAYNVATTLGSLTAIIPSAFYISVFPRFTNLSTIGEEEQLVNSFLKVNRLVNLILTSMAAYIAIFAPQLILLWTKSEVYVERLGVVGCLVVMAVAVIEFQEIPYALALAKGNTKINILVGVIFLPIVCVSTYFSISKFGLLGAGVVYVVMMVGQTLMYQILVCKKYMPNNIYRVILQDTAFPLLFSMVTAISVHLIINKIGLDYIFSSILAVLFGGVNLVILFLIYYQEKRGKK